MTAWTSDELSKIGAAEELDRVRQARRQAAKSGDNLGRPPR